MAQHDYNIANQTAANARTDINNVLSAIATNNSGTAAPSTTFANQWWYDTDAFILYIRANGNDAWIPVAYLDQTNDEFRILDDTIVVNIFGTQIGRLGDQPTSTWETGTGTTETLVSPAKVAASATEVVGNFALGVDQTWQDMTSSRAVNVTYQNTTGRPIFIGLSATVSNGKTWSLEVSPNSNMSASITISQTFDINGATSVSGIIPNNIYYQASIQTAPSGLIWAELR